MKTAKRALALILSVVVLFSACVMSANAEDVTANHNDGLSKLFAAKTEFCLYCGEIHTGVGGSFTRFFHDVAYFSAALSANILPQAACGFRTIQLTRARTSRFISYTRATRMSAL